MIGTFQSLRENASAIVTRLDDFRERFPVTRTDPDLIDTIAALEARYPAARPASRAKERHALTPAMREWLARSPFLVLSSVAANGIDCSPRGDAPGEAFDVLDDARIAIPDRRGNNRIDTLRNLVADPRVGLVFLVPGVEETLRVRGRASISVADELLERFRLDGQRPASVIVVAIEAVWVQNFRAVRRAGLWRPATHVAPGAVPDAAALSSPGDPTRRRAPPATAGPGHPHGLTGSPGRGGTGKHEPWKAD